MKKTTNQIFKAVLGISLLAPSVLPMSVMAATKAPEVKVKSVEFIGMASPTLAEELSETFTTASIEVTFTDGTIKTYPLNYNNIYKTGETINGKLTGGVVDIKGQPLMDTTVPASPSQYFSDSPDANGILTQDGKLTLFTHFEYISKGNDGKSAYGIIPASIGQSSLTQDKKTGALKATDYSVVDFSQSGGLWIPCAGSISPWNTFLSSEEYEPDASAFEADATKTFVTPFTKAYYQDAAVKGNPYLYGYIPEVSLNKDKTTKVVKHFSMGRFSHELARVAPDNKTVFFGDDGGNTMLFMYVADKAKDLSAGTLYAAKWVQTSATNGGAANLEWIKLGHASDAEIKSIIDSGIKFSDIFETAKEATPGFTAIKSYPSEKIEYLKVKAGKELAAAFLESRRYGAILGATSEFNKMEGVAINVKDKKAFIAMANVEKAMAKDTTGTEPTDHIQVDAIKAGAVYELALKPGQVDQTKATIASSYVPATMSSLVYGKDLATADAFGNKADAEMIANPDNLGFSESLRTLFIGEDSSLHANNYLWAYNVDTKKLTRILSIAAGGEATGLDVIDNLNGFSYVLSNTQHPGDGILYPEPLKTTVNAFIDKKYNKKRAGEVGYISGIPSMSQLLAWKKADKTSTSVVELSKEAKNEDAKVAWDAKSKTATVTNGDHVLVAKLGTNAVTIDGKVYQTPAKTVLTKNKLMVSKNILEYFFSK